MTNNQLDEAVVEEVQISEDVGQLDLLEKYTQYLQRLNKALLLHYDEETNSYRSPGPNYKDGTFGQIVGILHDASDETATACYIVQRKLAATPPPGTILEMAEHVLRQYQPTQEGDFDSAQGFPICCVLSFLFQLKVFQLLLSLYADDEATLEKWKGMFMTELTSSMETLVNSGFALEADLARVGYKITGMDEFRSAMLRRDMEQQGSVQVEVLRNDEGIPTKISVVLDGERCDVDLGDSCDDTRRAIAATLDLLSKRDEVSTKEIAEASGILHVKEPCRSEGWPHIVGAAAKALRKTLKDTGYKLSSAMREVTEDDGSQHIYTHYSIKREGHTGHD